MWSKGGSHRPTQAMPDGPLHLSLTHKARDAMDTAYDQKECIMRNARHDPNAAIILIERLAGKLDAIAADNAKGQYLDEIDRDALRTCANNIRGAKRDIRRDYIDHEEPGPLSTMFGGALGGSSTRARGDAQPTREDKSLQLRMKDLEDTARLSTAPMKSSKAQAGLSDSQDYKAIQQRLGELEDRAIQQRLGDLEDTLRASTKQKAPAKSKKVQFRSGETKEEEDGDTQRKIRDLEDKLRLKDLEDKLRLKDLEEKLRLSETTPVVSEESTKVRAERKKRGFSPKRAKKVDLKQQQPEAIIEEKKDAREEIQTLLLRVSDLEDKLRSSTTQKTPAEPSKVQSKPSDAKDGDGDLQQEVRDLEDKLRSSETTPKVPDESTKVRAERKKRRFSSKKAKKADLTQQSRPISEEERKAVEEAKALQLRISDLEDQLHQASTQKDADESTNVGIGDSLLAWGSSVMDAAASEMQEYFTPEQPETPSAPIQRAAPGSTAQSDKSTKVQSEGKVALPRVDDTTYGSRDPNEVATGGVGGEGGGGGTAANAGTAAAVGAAVGSNTGAGEGAAEKLAKKKKKKKKKKRGFSAKKAKKADPTQQQPINEEENEAMKESEALQLRISDLEDQLRQATTQKGANESTDMQVGLGDSLFACGGGDMMGLTSDINGKCASPDDEALQSEVADPIDTVPPAYAPKDLGEVATGGEGGGGGAGAGAIANAGTAGAAVSSSTGVGESKATKLVGRSWKGRFSSKKAKKAELTKEQPINEEDKEAKEELEALQSVISDLEDQSRQATTQKGANESTDMQVGLGDSLFVCGGGDMMGATSDIKGKCASPADAALQLRIEELEEKLRLLEAANKVPDESTMMKPEDGDAAQRVEKTTHARTRSLKGRFSSKKAQKTKSRPKASTSSDANVPPETAQLVQVFHGAGDAQPTHSMPTSTDKSELSGIEAVAGAGIALTPDGKGKKTKKSKSLRKILFSTKSAGAPPSKESDLSDRAQPASSPSASNEKEQAPSAVVDMKAIADDITVFNDDSPISPEVGAAPAKELQVPADAQKGPNAQDALGLGCAVLAGVAACNASELSSLEQPASTPLATSSESASAPKGNEQSPSALVDTKAIADATGDGKDDSPTSSDLVRRESIKADDVPSITESDVSDTNKKLLLPKDNEKDLAYLNRLHDLVQKESVKADKVPSTTESDVLDTNKKLLLSKDNEKEVAYLKSLQEMSQRNAPQPVNWVAITDESNGDDVTADDSNKRDGASSIDADDILAKAMAGGLSAATRSMNGNAKPKKEEKTKRGKLSRVFSKKNKAAEVEEQQKAADVDEPDSKPKEKSQTFVAWKSSSESKYSSVAALNETIETVSLSEEYGAEAEWTALETTDPLRALGIKDGDDDKEASPILVTWQSRRPKSSETQGVPLDESIEATHAPISLDPFEFEKQTLENTVETPSTSLLKSVLPHGFDEDLFEEAVQITKLEFQESVTGAFAKAARAIQCASQRVDGDMSDQSLQTAIAAGRSIQLPEDKIDAAVEKGINEELIDIRYDCAITTKNGKVSLIVTALTGDRERTAANVRAALANVGGVMLDTGENDPLFEHAGVVIVSLASLRSEEEEEAMFECALNGGATDFLPGSDGATVIKCDPTNLHNLVVTLREGGFALREFDTKYIVRDTDSGMVELSDESAEQLENLWGMLTKDDGVTDVYHNATYEWRNLGSF